MGEITYENKILAIDNKLVDGNKIRSMTDAELKKLIQALYDIGFDDGYAVGNEDGYDNGYDDGWTDRSYDCEN